MFVWARRKIRGSRWIDTSLVGRHIKKEGDNGVAHSQLYVEAVRVCVKQSEFSFQNPIGSVLGRKLVP